MSVIGTIHEDVTTDVLGDIGAWQWIVTFVCTMLMTSGFFHHYEDIFLLHPSKVYCIPDAVQSELFNETLCTYNVRNGTEIQCERWQIKLFWLLWVKKSWIIFCDDKMKLLLSAVICRSATVFGFVIFGLVADSFGRKVAVICNIFGSFGLGIVCTFCDSEGWYRLGLFLGSLIGTSNVMMSIVIVCEIASNSWRSWLTLIVISPRLVALISMVTIANETSNSETYNLIGCLFCLIYFIMLRWIPESPQWMLYNRKIHVAERLLSRAAETNRIIFSADFKIRPVNQRAYMCLDEPMTCFQVWSQRNLRLLFCVTITFWGLFYFIWATLYLKAYNDGIDVYVLLKVLSFLVAFGFVSAFLSSILTMQRFLVIYVMLTALVVAATVFLKQQFLHDILSSLALASGLVVHALILNMTPRFYAINLRATLFGCCHATGHIGAMVGYIIHIYDTMDDITFAAVEIVISLILVILSFLMPNVDGRELPDVIEDMDYFTELSKPLRWATQKRTSPSKEEVEMRIYSFGSNAMASTSTNRHMSERLPAEPIGIKTLYRRLIAFCKRKKIVTPEDNLSLPTVPASIPSEVKD